METPMKRPAHLAAIAALVATPPLAQEGDIRQAAEQFVENEAMQTTLDQVLAPETFVAQLRATATRLSEEEIRSISEIVNAELADARPQLEAALATAAAETFTLSELEAMNEFYESETGRSTAAKMQRFMQSFYEEVGPTLAAVQMDIVGRMAEEFGAPGAATDGEAGAGGDE
jgi:hypothetical protein